MKLYGEAQCRESSGTREDLSRIKSPPMLLCYTLYGVFFFFLRLFVLLSRDAKVKECLIRIILNAAAAAGLGGLCGTGENAFLLFGLECALFFVVISARQRSDVAAAFVYDQAV